LTVYIKKMVFSVVLKEMVLDTQVLLAFVHSFQSRLVLRSRCLHVHLRTNLLPLFGCLHAGCFVVSPSFLWLSMLLHYVCTVAVRLTILLLAHRRVYVFDQVISDVVITAFLSGEVTVNGRISLIGVISWQACTKVALGIDCWFSVVWRGNFPHWFWSWNDLPHKEWVSVGHLTLLQRRVIELDEVSTRDDVAPDKLCFVIAENLRIFWSLVLHLIVEER